MYLFFLHVDFGEGSLPYHADLAEFVRIENKLGGGNIHGSSIHTSGPTNKSEKEEIQWIPLNRDRFLQPK